MSSVILFFLHERRELDAVFFHHFHRRLHLALAALFTAFNLLADDLEKLRVLRDECGHLFTLFRRHVFHLPLGVLIDKETLERHGRMIPRFRARPLDDAAYGSCGEIERDKRKESERLEVGEGRIEETHS